MRAAVKRQFEAIDAKGQVVASGDIGGNPVTLLPGHYTVRLRGHQDVSTGADVKPNASATVVLRQ